MNRLNRSCIITFKRVRLLSTSSNLKVGFIGLGNMGASMAINLSKSPCKDNLQVYDIVPQNVKKLTDMGIKSSASISALAASSNVLVTMVPATQHVLDVLKGPNGIFKNAKRDTIIIDCSTIDPIVSKQLNEEAKSLGLHMIDAPVSGGVTGAAAGTLTFMVGGESSVMQKVAVVLNSMGKKIVLCGGPGNGGVTKLCNNLSLAISMIGTSEALALGKRLGMDPVKLSEVMNTSTARCWSSDSYNPAPGVMENVPSSRGYTGGFGSALMEKDLGLALSAAKDVKARLPLGATAHQLYGLMCEHGFGEKDFSSIYEFLFKNLKK